MKITYVLMLMLVLTTLVVGCSKQTSVNDVKDVSSAEEFTNQNVDDELTRLVIEEEDDVELGELI